MSAFDNVWAVKDPITVTKMNNPMGRVPGSASASYRIAFGGVLFAANGALGNATTVETTVYSRTVRANVCSVDGDRLEIDLWGAWAANANTKTVRFKFGAHGTYYTLGAQNINGGLWHARILLTRSGATTGSAIIQVTTNTQSSGVVTAAVEGALTGLTWSADQTLSTTLQGTSTSDIVARDYLVLWRPGTAEVV